MAIIKFPLVLCKIIPFHVLLQKTGIEEKKVISNKLIFLFSRTLGLNSSLSFFGATCWQIRLHWDPTPSSLSDCMRTSLVLNVK